MFRFGASDVKGILWLFLSIVIGEYIGSLFGWWHAMNTQEFISWMLFCMFLAVIQIGVLLERIAPPSPRETDD